jgi:hypothetical protein
MFCEYKCRYELNSYLTEEIEIQIGKVNSVTLPQQSSLSYYVNISKDNYDEFNLIATNLQLIKILLK